MYNAWIDPLGFNAAFGSYGYGSWSDFLTGVAQGTTGVPSTAAGTSGAVGGTVGGLVGSILGTNRPATSPQPLTSPTGQVAVNYPSAAPAAAIGIPALIIGGLALWYFLRKK